MPLFFYLIANNSEFIYTLTFIGLFDIKLDRKIISAINVAHQINTKSDTQVNKPLYFCLIAKS